MIGFMNMSVLGDISQEIDTLSGECVMEKDRKILVGSFLGVRV
jgi:hypothetical protein